MHWVRAILPDMDMTRNGILGLNSAFVIVVSPSLQSSLAPSTPIELCIVFAFFYFLLCIVLFMS